MKDKENQEQTSPANHTEQAEYIKLIEGIEYTADIKPMRNISNINHEKELHEIVQAPQPNQLIKKIGNTTYIINFCFSDTSKETIQDKILRVVGGIENVF